MSHSETNIGQAPVSRTTEITGLEIIAAASSGLFHLISWLLEENRIDEITRNRALCAAAHCGKVHILDLLLSYGSDLHFQCDAPLFFAVTGGHVGVIRILLQRGALCEMSALQWAFANGQHHIIALLLNHRPLSEDECALLLKSPGIADSRICRELVLKWSADDFLANILKTWKAQSWDEWDLNSVPNDVRSEMVLRRLI